MAEFLLLVGSMGALAFAVACVEVIWRVLRTAALMLRTKPLWVFALRVSISSRGGN